MRYKTEIDNVVVEVVNGAGGYKVTKHVSGHLHETSTFMDVDRAIDLAVRWTQYAIEEIHERRTQQLLEEERLAFD